MAEFTLDEVCRATRGQAEKAELCTSFFAVSTDTRKITKGDLFVALIGERYDGHDFIKNAVDQGAAGILASRSLPSLPDVPVIFVEDTRKALQDLARFHRRRFNIPVIAITGSNGKTTTKDMVAAVLASRLRVLKTEANFNNEIGLPLTLLNLTDQHQAAVVEMGMRGKGEIRELAEIAQPTMGVVTNVGETHIELLGSVSAIAEAKAELVETIGADGLVVLNYDNQYVRSMREKTAARVVGYGLDTGADVRAEDIISQGSQTAFTCHAGKLEFPVRLPVPGKHNVYNALAAVAVGLELGLPPEDITAGLMNFTPGAMRLHVEKYNDLTIINDAYNASPLSMNAAIETLNDIAKGRKIAVLGDMLELGDFAEKAHRAIGRTLAEKAVDAVITVGEYAGFIADTAKENGVPTAIACPGHTEAKRALSELMLPGDTILVKGSRGMKMEKMLDLFK